jgi:imidazolonepropionase-like amidohydrolase
MKKVAVCICLFLATLGIAAQNNASVIVFQHANLIDGVSSEPLRDVTVTIANGKITGIQKSLKRMPAGAEVIDLKGKWLLPGYIDAHVHINFEQAQRALRRRSNGFYVRVPV